MNAKATNITTSIPPTAPSTVLPGLITGVSLVLPQILPHTYAALSDALTRKKANRQSAEPFVCNRKNTKVENPNIIQTLTGILQLGLDFDASNHSRQPKTIKIDTITINKILGSVRARYMAMYILLKVIPRLLSNGRPFEREKSPIKNITPRNEKISTGNRKPIS